MKSYAYLLEQRGPRTLEDVVRPLHDLQLGQRSFPITGDMRLERAQFEDNWIYMDFARGRPGHGPGRMGRDLPMQGIELEEGYIFGEDTAMIYDADTRCAAVQYNHYGPRASHIYSYLGAADRSRGGLRALRAGEGDEERCGYRFASVLKPEAYARLREFEIFREFEFAISVPGARACDQEAGRSLSSILDAPLPGGIDTIQVKMKAAGPRNSDLGREGVMGYVTDLRRMGAEVKRLMVKGKATEGAPIDEIDLIEERLSGDTPIRMGRGLRYTTEDRWRALSEAMQQWRDAGHLPVQAG